MKSGPFIVALTASVVMLSACGNDDERTAENAYRDTTPSMTYPDTTTAPPSTSTTPVYPNPDPNTIPPTVNPDAPVNPDGTLPPNIPPAPTPPN